MVICVMVRYDFGRASTLVLRKSQLFCKQITFFYSHICSSTRFVRMRLWITRADFDILYLIFGFCGLRKGEVLCVVCYGGYSFDVLRPGSLVVVGVCLSDGLVLKSSALGCVIVDG
jgi:hypothetical protein